MVITKSVLLNQYYSMKKKRSIWIIFDTSPLTQFSEFKNFPWASWFFGKKLSNVVLPIWKLHNPYCHSVQSWIGLNSSNITSYTKLKATTDERVKFQKSAGINILHLNIFFQKPIFANNKNQSSFEVCTLILIKITNVGGFNLHKFWS